MSFLSKIFGDSNERYVKNARLLVEEINKKEADLEKLSKEEIQAKTSGLKKRLTEGETTDVILPEAFALVREAAKRTIGQRHYDVQLIGGIALHQGKIGEMKTGEGKTLVATLPVVLNALTGKGVHVVTVNDYLARRDTAWMGQIYDYLGLTVSCLNHETSYIYDAKHISQEEEKDKTRDELGSFKVVHEYLRPITKREAYAADITYGTNNEYGFDYLRDNMVMSLEQKVQSKGHNFAIVDEVDSILIDEARTPLIISAPDNESTKLYETFSKIVPRFVENEDYNVDEKLKAVSITEKGIEKVESALGVGNIYEEGGLRYVHHLEQALRSHVLFKLDRDYVVKDGEVIIVDEFTGRLMPGRRWSDGLHQAVEAKEGVLVQKESRTMATITFQNYFRLYKKLGGMTGTAATSAEEFHKVYNIDVIIIPSNKIIQRADLTDRIYKTEAGKFRAVAKEVKEKNAKGQPVLVGTVSIQKNELLSKLLEREGVTHQVLNAKNHEREAEIIAQAGKWGAVTVATNMAGRGVDIILGGQPNDKEEAEKVRAAGGLHVIGTERHEARRIDNQLRGRAGRQGDPGSSQFFVSTEDDLARVFGGDRLKNLMERLGVSDEDMIQNSFVSRAIEQAQSRIEGHHFDSRKYVLEYDDVMNRHRTAIYNLRNQILAEPNSRSLIWEYLEWGTQQLVMAHTVSETGEWNTKEIDESVRSLVGLEKSILPELGEVAKTKDPAALHEWLMEFLTKEYEKKEAGMGAEAMRRLEGLVLLRVIDEIWVDHLETMEYLKESVRLRAYGQRDPLAEYKIEAQKLFDQLLTTVKSQAANLIFKVSFVSPVRSSPSIESSGPRLRAGEASNGMQQATTPKHGSDSDTHNIGRNDPCWCGSGKKYKKCHLNRKS
ncbi:MAG: preprotein translocase subunit SecA [bacterium]|nr:preprotein translocase subunit SecA [bacterium]